MFCFYWATVWKAKVMQRSVLIEHRFPITLWREISFNNKLMLYVKYYIFVSHVHLCKILCNYVKVVYSVNLLELALFCLYLWCNCCTNAFPNSCAFLVLLLFWQIYLSRWHTVECCKTNTHTITILEVIRACLKQDSVYKYFFFYIYIFYIIYNFL